MIFAHFLHHIYEYNIALHLYTFYWNKYTLNTCNYVWNKWCCYLYVFNITNDQLIVRQTSSHENTTCSPYYKCSCGAKLQSLIHSHN